MQQCPPILKQLHHYAALQLDGRRLLLPQSEVFSLEPTQDLDASEADGVGIVGYITLTGKMVPVYCFTRELVLSEIIPEVYRLCVLLQGQQGVLFGILCNNVTAIETANSQLLPVPNCMRLPNMPICSLLLSDEELICITTAANIEALIEHSYESALAVEI